jgi:hypothetical protein
MPEHGSPQRCERRRCNPIASSAVAKSRVGGSVRLGIFAASFEVPLRLLLRSDPLMLGRPLV